MLDDEKPKWEKGVKVHGYWLGAKRLGWVGLPPGHGTATREGYGWGFEGSSEVTMTEGHAETLRKAKQAVEHQYRQSKKASHEVK